MLQTQAQNYDPFFARGLTNYLFRQRGMNFGQDLVTRNIQVSLLSVSLLVEAETTAEPVGSYSNGCMTLTHREEEITEFLDTTDTADTAGFHL